MTPRRAVARGSELGVAFRHGARIGHDSRLASSLSIGALGELIVVPGDQTVRFGADWRGAVLAALVLDDNSFRPNPPITARYRISDASAVSAVQGRRSVAGTWAFRPKWS